MFKKLIIMVALLCGAQAYGMHSSAAESSVFSWNELRTSDVQGRLKKQVERFKDLSPKVRSQVKANVSKGTGDKIGPKFKPTYEALLEKIETAEAEIAQEEKKKEPQKEELKKDETQKDESKEDVKKNPSWFSNLFTLKKVGLFAIGTLVVYGCVNFFKKRSGKPAAAKRK